MEIEHRPRSSTAFTVLTVAVGTALGLYLVSRMGRGNEEYDDWDVRRHGRRQGFFSRLGRLIPLRTKAAAGVGAIKGGLGETIEHGKEKLGTALDR